MNAWSLQEVIHRIPWSVVLMMINDRTRLKRQKKVQGTDSDEITSEEEALQFFNLK